MNTSGTDLRETYVCIDNIFMQFVHIYETNVNVFHEHILSICDMGNDRCNACIRARCA